ncbi:MAG: hypothetical protein V4733_04555 [Verrucomicrobiota bacterium]
MNLRVLAGLCLCFLAADAKTPDNSASLARMIVQLADETYKTREEATLKLWNVGEPALPLLREATRSPDPERAIRAGDMVRKIEMHLTPGTDGVVVDLVEKFLAARERPEERVRLMGLLREQRAWRPMLKLFAAETSAKARAGMERMLQGVALAAARERVAAKDPRGAREMLELGGTSPAALLALADFDRQQGSPRAAPQGVSAAAWKLANIRATMDLAALPAAAQAAGENRLAAAGHAFNGDPLPWLDLIRKNGDQPVVTEKYCQAAAHRWLKNDPATQEIAALKKILTSGDDNGTARIALLCLGENAAVAEALGKTSRLDKFAELNFHERVPEALSSLDLDPAKPDYAAHVAGIFQRLKVDEDEEEDEEGGESLRELLELAQFLEFRGMHEEARRAFEAPLLELAKRDQEKFLQWIAYFVTQSDSGRSPAAPRLGCVIAKTWAGEDAGRLDNVIELLGDPDVMKDWWSWLGEIDPKQNPPARFDGLTALLGLRNDFPDRTRMWMEKITAHIEQAPPAEKLAGISRMLGLREVVADAKDECAWLDRLPEKQRNVRNAFRTMSAYAAAGRWNDAANVILREIDDPAVDGGSPARAHAQAAAFLRRAEHDAEAKTHDGMVEKLVMGYPREAYFAALGYAMGCDFEHARLWKKRAAVWWDPEDRYFSAVLDEWLNDIEAAGDWKRAAGIGEMVLSLRVAHSFAEIPANGSTRLSVDLARAMAGLRRDKAASLQLLETIYRGNYASGALADDFFPALRKAGLSSLHDEWFAKSWSGLNDVIRVFPGSDNTRNTAAWLASRCKLNLDEAETLIRRSLENDPRNEAYLDTMAEIEFARGNRDAAIQWSDKAVNVAPFEILLKQQNQRFRHAPF